MRALLTAAVLLAALLAAPLAVAHQGSPNFLSRVNAIDPQLDGLSVSVLNRDDRLLMQNTSGEDVLILGYTKEPYARIDADRSVWVNTNSRAHYINEERDGEVAVPAGIDADSPPRWERVDGSGRFEWHDHRMHWMSEADPEVVKDKDVRTKVFDWNVPLEVDGRAGAIAGTLFWTPAPSSNLPVAAILAFAGLIIALSVAVIVVRRRRAPVAAGDREAW